MREEPEANDDPVRAVSWAIAGSIILLGSALMLVAGLSNSDSGNTGKTKTEIKTTKETAVKTKSDSENRVNKQIELKQKDEKTNELLHKMRKDRKKQLNLQHKNPPKRCGVLSSHF